MSRCVLITTPAPKLHKFKKEKKNYFSQTLPQLSFSLCTLGWFAKTEKNVKLKNGDNLKFLSFTILAKHSPTKGDIGQTD